MNKTESEIKKIQKEIKEKKVLLQKLKKQRKIELLKLLDIHGKLSQYGFKEISDLPFATIRRYLEQLRQKDLVYFEKSSRNAKIFSLTERGKKLLQSFEIC